MTFQELRDRVIDDGIREVKETYADDDPRQAGAIEGFELCRSLGTRDAFENVLRARQQREMRKVIERQKDQTQEQANAYRKHRYATLQVEWVLNCLLAAGWARPGDMLSGRAVRKVAGVVGSSDFGFK